ncbi:MAG TPA: hypothetical protein VH370_03050 [Humisphaera sp.]|jgi:hypothetical protein|nr:hypothetical protein [Humisphaera sp.]
MGAIIYRAPKPKVGPAQPANSTSPVGLTPSQMRSIYGMDQVMFGNVAGNGAGQTIAIVDAFDAPSALPDLQHFDQTFGLPDPPTFTRVAQDGTTNYPPTDTKGGWAVETALDVEWAHVMAPMANILLVEAKDAFDSNLINTAVNYARRQPGVVAVSMSWSGGESSGETSLDTFFTTPSGHAGVTFFAATGDNGAPAGYPATSPNVVAVGGTTLQFDTAGNFTGEVGWSGSGGSTSPVESEPSYQKGVVPSSITATRRAAPDISIDADPASGVAVYDTFDFPSAPWLKVGGTSLSTPMWAGIVAVADQARSLVHLSSMDGRTQTLPAIYALPAADIRDITSGSNGHSALVGYDLVTGRGSPILNKLVYDLAGVQKSAFSTAVTISGTSGNDTIYINLNGSTLQEWINAATPGQGTPTHQDSLTGATAVSIVGGGGNDTVILDMSGGNFLATPATISNAGGTIALEMNGATGGDNIFIDGANNKITYDAGVLNFANVNAITFFDSGGGDTVESAGPIAVELDVTGDDTITIDSGNVLLDILDNGTTPPWGAAASTPAALTAAVTPSTTTTSNPAPTPTVTSRKPYRPPVTSPHRGVSFSTIRI